MGLCKVEYPWQEQQWRQVTQMAAEGKIPHALLLIGSKGLGKLQFAQDFAKTLLCSKSQEQFCNDCRSCHLFDAGTHPDSILLQPKDAAKTIKIEDIRELIASVAQCTQQSRYRVVVIEPVETMNPAAANAFLKIAEEPPGHTIFLLVCHHLSRLLPTVRSRCQLVKFFPPSKEQASLWLKSRTNKQDDIATFLSSDLAPLQALEWLESDAINYRKELLLDLSLILQQQVSLVKIVEKWLSWPSDIVACLLASFFVDMIRIKSQLSSIAHQDMRAILEQQAAFFKLSFLYQLLDKLYSIQQMLKSQTSVNMQLQFEDFLVTALKAKGE